MDRTSVEEQAGAASASAAAGRDLKPDTGRTENVPRGILCMVLATMLFSIAFAFSKWQVAIYPAGEVVFLRSLSSLVVVAGVMLPITGFSVFATRRPRDHVLRGLSQSISQTLSILAFSLMPLAGAVAINFSAPLFAALVAILWLKERASFARWSALLVGFFGVLIVTDPGAGSLTLGALFALGNAVMYGSVTVAVRGMTKTESANTLLIWQMVVIASLQSLLVVFGWRTPAPVDAAMLFASGFSNAIGQYFWTQALRLAPAMAVSPFYYLMLVWALILGFLIWGDVPSVGLLIGSAIVVGSSLFLLWRETQAKRAAMAMALVTTKAATP
jgi:drug/metabolite transporter (DMT)-like permease